MFVHPDARNDEVDIGIGSKIWERRGQDIVRGVDVDAVMNQGGSHTLDAAICLCRFGKVVQLDRIFGRLHGRIAQSGQSEFI